MQCISSASDVHIWVLISIFQLACSSSCNVLKSLPASTLFFPTSLCFIAVRASESLQSFFTNSVIHSPHYTPFFVPLPPFLTCPLSSPHIPSSYQCVLTSVLFQLSAPRLSWAWMWWNFKVNSKWKCHIHFKSSRAAHWPTISGSVVGLMSKRLLQCSMFATTVEAVIVSFMWKCPFRPWNSLLVEKHGYDAFEVAFM